MSKFELGKWYIFQGLGGDGVWDILPLRIRNDKVDSIDVESDGSIHVDNEKLSWFTKRLGDTLTLRIDPLLLSYKQKTDIFKIIFGSKE